MKNFLLSLILVLAFASCQTVARKMYGIKDPSIESKAKIVKKAHKFGLDTTNIVTVNSKDFLRMLIGKGIPDAAIYDKSGKYIEYRQTDTSCNAGLFAFIPALNLTSKYNQPDSANLDTQLQKFRDLGGNTLAPRQPADFYLLIYWTVWTGILNKDHVKAWEDLAKNNKNCQIKVVKVNLDMQKYWDKDEQDRIAKALAAKK